MKIKVFVTLFLLTRIQKQQNISDLVAQYQNGGGASAFDPKSLKLPSIDPSSINQLKSYAEQRAAEQYNFDTILQKQLQSGNPELQNQIQQSSFFRNQAQNFNTNNLSSQNQQTLSNLLLQNQSTIQNQFQQPVQQQQFQSLQQQPQINQSQQNLLSSNPQLMSQLQQMLQQQQQQPQQQNVLQNQPMQNQNLNNNSNQNQFQNLFNDNQSNNQQRQDKIILGNSAQLKQVSVSIKGTEELAGYLDLLSSFEKNRFKTQGGQPVDNCEILQRISPINKSSEQLTQCKGVHVHGVGNDTICFIFACRNSMRRVMFYKICMDAIPLDQNMLNLNNLGEDNRNFEKDSSPNRFMQQSDFSLQDPINCKNGKTIIRDSSLINIK